MRHCGQLSQQFQTDQWLQDPATLWLRGATGMKSFFAWFQDNSTQIAWFLIGFFVYGAVDNFARGNWYGAGINLLFAGMNYFINRK
jgi:hypothetical protein